MKKNAAEDHKAGSISIVMMAKNRACANKNVVDICSPRYADAETRIIDGRSIDESAAIARSARAGVIERQHNMCNDAAIETSARLADLLDLEKGFPHGDPV